MKKTYYYKRTIKRISKLVWEFIRQHGDNLPLDCIWANPVSGDVILEGGEIEEPCLARPAMFFTKADDNFHRVIDEKSIRHWVMVDLRRLFVAVTTPVHLPLRSL